jgi:hypothetical protein
MTESYRELLEYLGGAEHPFQTLTLQISFIVYLVLGQFVLLFLWRLLSGAARRFRAAPAPADTRRSGGIVFALYLLFGQVVLFLAWPFLVSAWLATDSIVLADILVVIHLALVLAVLLGLVLILVSFRTDWGWTRNFWLRITQLIVIEVVAGQAVVGLECPLATAERELRGGPGYLNEVDQASPVGRFCNEVLYIGPKNWPRWVYMAIYGTVGLLVLLTWSLVPPRLPWRRPIVPAGEPPGKQPSAVASAALTTPIRGGAS